MSRAAARAMRVLAKAMRKEAEAMGPGTAYAVVKALADAHDECAAALEEEAAKLESAVASQPGDVRYCPKGRAGR